MDGDPLLALGVLVDLVVPSGGGVPGGVEELGAGAIQVADLEMTLLPLAAVHRGDLLLKTGHKVLERSPVVDQGLLARLEVRGGGRGLHLVPIHPVGSLHHTVRYVRFLIEGAVVPESTAHFHR